jgi:arylsulfatase A-like enzyme
MNGGQTTRSLAEFVDVYPTLTDLCGLKMPHAAAGASLRPLLIKPEASIKDSAFTLVTRTPKLHGQSVRTARWRFNLWSDGHTELYDHDADPEELRNIAADHADVVSELTANLETLPKLQP